MNNKKRALIGLFMLLASSLSGRHNHIKTSQYTGNECFMGKFVEAVEKMKKICAKNPNNPMCKRLHNANALNVNIDVQSVINIAHHLEKEERINDLSKKITKRLNDKPDLIKRCFVDGDKKSCIQFRKYLKTATFKCGGFGCIGKGRAMCEAAAFTAATKCLECKKQHKNGKS